MFKLNAKFDADSLLCLLSHFECDGHTVHMLTQGHLPPPRTSTVTPQSPSKWAPWELTQFSQSPSAAPSYFPESHPRSEISSLPKVILVWGKARSRRASSVDCRGAESPGCSDVLPKNPAQDVIHEWVCFHNEAANHQLPIAVAF